MGASSKIFLEQREREEFLRRAEEEKNEMDKFKMFDLVEFANQLLLINSKTNKQNGNNEKTIGTATR